MTTTVVYGPPGAGKTTYINEHRKAGDVVIDLDALAVAIGSPDDHDHPHLIRQVAGAARASAIRKATEIGAVAWVVDTWLRTRVLREYDCEYVLVDPGQGVTLRRAEQAGRPESSMAAIRRWYLDPPIPPRTASAPRGGESGPADLGAGVANWW